jgi:hypothetical protein
MSSNIGERTRTHGMCRTPEYAAWSRIKLRCHNPSHPDYSDYGARGILMCDEWKHSFVAFYAYVGAKPKGTSIDRIDNARGYEPGNVQWATPLKQAQNTRNNLTIFAFGKSQCLAEWAREYSLCPETISYRLKQGIDPELAISRRPYES